MLAGRLKSPPALVVDHEITYAEAEPWLAGRDRAVFERRFTSRLRDPAFRSAVMPNAARYPTWDRILNPQKYEPKKTTRQGRAQESARQVRRPREDKRGEDGMKLIWKFNLVLLGIFVLGFVVAGYLSYRALQTNAREEILQNARLMMEAALSSRTYTVNQVKPLLETHMKYEFLPQTVPAYAATEQFNELRKKHPDYSYKEATLNPTNPRNRAADWEADVVNIFRNTSDDQPR